jgi:RNA polymerase sigma-70 factor (ECF subfamily)
MPDEAISDEVLMRRFQEAFDEKAFDELLARYHRPALFLARNLSANPSLAEDAVQETFIRIVRARSRFDCQQSFASWFYTILRHVCSDGRRKEVRRAEQLQELAQQEGPVHHPPDAEDEMTALLQSLSPADRDTLIYRFVHGMTFGEIAEQTGVSVEAAKKRAQRALKQLRTR